MGNNSINKSDLAFVHSYLNKLISDNIATNTSSTLFRNRSWSRHDEGAFSLTDEQAREQEEVSRRLSRTVYRRNDLSPQSIESALVDAMFITLDLPSRRSNIAEERVKEAVDHLLSFLNSNLQTFDCWLPIDGFRETALPATFGRCRFETVGSQHFGHVSTVLRSVGGPHLETSLKQLLPVLSHNMEGKAAAILSLAAKETGGALNMATEEVQETIECLNFFGPAIPFNYSTLSLAKGHTGLGVSHQLAIGAEGAISHGSALTSMPASYSIHELLSFPGQVGASARMVDSLLKQERRSKVDELLIRAVRWAGRGVSAESLEDKLLFFTIALECLALPDGKAELSYRLSQRVARAIGSDLGSRQTTFDDVKRLYDMRSGIVHGGREEISEYDVATIHAIALSFIVHMLTEPEVGSLTSLKALRKYFNRITMS